MNEMDCDFSYCMNNICLPIEFITCISMKSNFESSTCRIEIPWRMVKCDETLGILA